MAIAIVTLLIVVAMTIIITRLGAMALVLTGLSRESASFQARSAFSGVGFTTNEAETVVNHPVRRRIVMLLMLAGSISVSTVVAAIGVSIFTTIQAEHWWNALILLSAGLLGLSLLAKSRWVEKRLNTIMSGTLKKWTNMDVRDYISLLQLQNGFVVTELLIDPGDWLEGKTLRSAALSHEGVLVLGIQRPDGKYIGTPRADDVIHVGDTLVLYSQIDRLQELDQRGAAAGDYAHQEAEAEHAAELMNEVEK